jgi:small subunit ribosomal protein S19
MIMVKIFLYKGKTLEELQKMSLEDFAKLIASRERRNLLRGFDDVERNFLQNIRKSDRPVKTHLREFVIIPELLFKRVLVHNGKEWIQVDIKPEMLGHRLGEFAMTRKRVMHSAPGVGATKSSKFLPLK